LQYIRKKRKREEECWDGERRQTKERQNLVPLHVNGLELIRKGGATTLIHLINLPTSSRTIDAAFSDLGLQLSFLRSRCFQ